ncbi:MAG TPA: hypothetical protein VKD90_26520 [Gemmataceae bacterium]|nr:hypothetical protein [Gemmataceae bacterium]
MWFLALASFVLSGFLLGLSVFPGVLEQIPSPVDWVLGGGLALVATGLAVRHLFESARPRRRAIVVLLCAVLTPILLLANVPRRAIFAQYRGEFERLLEQAPPPGSRAVVGLNADLRIYWVDQWGTDARGGTYFRTMAGSGPSRASFGFVHRPNPDGSPFGDQDYKLHRLTGDWYSFAVAE